MNIKAIIFDMDGTIVNTNPLWDEAVATLVRNKGVTDDALIQKIQDAICGVSVDKACKKIKELAQLEDSIEQLKEEKMALVLSLYGSTLQFIPGFEAFHAMITKHNIQSAIATNADDATFEKTKQALQLHRFFGEHMYNISCVGNVCKPNPDVYLHAAQQLGCKPEECIAIEDSYAGILAAKRAGMYCIGINTNKNRASLSLADRIIEDYTELMTIFS